MAGRWWHALSFVACVTASTPRSGPGLFDEMPLIEVARETRRQPREELKAGMNLARMNSSMELSLTFQKLAARLPEGPTKEVMSRLKVCSGCTDWRRLGEERDGGYLVCWDGMQEGKLRAAYSMGVEMHDGFSDQIYALLKVPVHQFDCTVEGPATLCGDCHFHKVCLAGQYGGGGHPQGPNMDMQEVLESTGQASAPDDSLIMKMDVEGAEWPIYADGQAGLSKFKQLIFEFHRLGEEENHPQYALALKNIETAGFKVAHIHGNNYYYDPDPDGMYKKDGYRVPNSLEVTFVKNNIVLDVCEADQHLHPLDIDNNPDRPPLPMAHLPE